MFRQNMIYSIPGKQITYREGQILRRVGGIKMRFHSDVSNELKVLVFNFRKAIEAAKANYEPGEFFRKFPVGQCGNASDILAQYLLDEGISPIIYVNGTYYGDNYNDRWAHTWLVVNGFVVDITGDQFKDKAKPLKNDVPIYIGPMTEYYRLFEIGPGGKCKHLGLDPTWYNYHELKDWYKTVLKYLT